MSDKNEDIAQFRWADYVVFSLALATSCAVGAYYSIKGRGKSTTEDYLMAGRSMPVLPVTISIFVSYFSAISFVAEPAETYSYGVEYFAICIGYVASGLMIAFIYAPLIHRMRVTSIYELLELRLGVMVRRVASISHLLYLVAYLSLAIYAPSLTISQACGLPVIWTIVLVASVSTFYTTLGGLKAVLWVDTVQCFVMVAGLLAVLVKGCIDVGGFSEMLRLSAASERLIPVSWVFNPLVHSSVFTYFVAGFFVQLMTHTAVQFLVQRFCVVKTPRDATWVVMLSLGMSVVCTAVLALLGLVISAYYYGCSPSATGRITRKDQLLVLLTLELFRDMPGVPGLFVAAICTASLSTLSSGQNALAVNVYKDVIEPLYKRVALKQFSDHSAIRLARIISLLSGFALAGAAILTLYSGKSVFHFNAVTKGCLLAPMAVSFLMAVCLPRVGPKPVLAGFFTGGILPVIVIIGSISYGYTPQSLPMTTEGCSVSNHTEQPHQTSTTATTAGYYTNVTHSDTEGPETPALFRISPLWFSALGYIATLCSTLFLYAMSLLIRKFSRKEKHDINKLGECEKGPESLPLNGKEEHCIGKTGKEKFSVMDC